MLVECGSNGVTIATGANGPVGYSCLFGSDYESISATVEEVINAGLFFLHDDSGNSFKVSLGAGRWVVKVNVCVKNTDVGGGHPDSVKVFLDGGPVNSFGSDVASGYTFTAVDGTTYSVYQITTITDEILAGTKDITVRVQVGVAAGTFIVKARSINAFKITSYTLV